jgi:hypothetical protein
MPSAKEKSSKPTLCSACGGVDLIRKITTYPVLLSSPLEGKAGPRWPCCSPRMFDLRTPHAHASGPGESRSQCRDGHPPVPRTTTLIGYRPRSHTLAHYRAYSAKTRSADRLSPICVLGCMCETPPAARTHAKRDSISETYAPLSACGQAKNMSNVSVDPLDLVTPPIRLA